MANLFDQAQRQKWDQTISQVQKMGYPQNPVQPSAVAPAPAPAAKDPLDGGAAFGFFPQLAGGKRTTYAMDEKLRTGVEATGPSTFVQATPLDKTIIGGGNGQRMNATQDPRSLLTATGMNAVAGVSPPPAPLPQGAAQPGSPAASASTVKPPEMGGNLPTPQPVGTSTAITPGVYQHGRGQYSDNASGMGMSAFFTGQPSAQNIRAADSLAGTQQAESMGRVQAQIAAELEAQRNSPQAMRKRALDILANRGSRRAAEALMGVAAGMDREETTRASNSRADARAAVSSALQRDEFGLKKEAAEFQTRAAQQQQEQRNVLADPKATPEQRAVAQRNLAALSGKTAADRMQTVTLPDTTNEMGQVVRGGQALVRVLEDGSVQQVPIGAQQAGASQPPANHVAALKANPKQAAQFDEIYGPGAAARAIGK